MAKPEDIRNKLAKKAEAGVKAASSKSSKNPVKAVLENPDVRRRIEEILDKRAPQFMSSIINLYQTDANLRKCDPMSIVGSCMVAATLDLPIDKNLGYAWIIPYGNQAQFQLGYKGYIQLALRSGQYRHINAIEVYEGELVSWNRLTEEIEFNFNNRQSDYVIGYAAYFELINGFKKTVYWSKEQVLAHAQRFSKGYKKESSPWNTDFDAMAMKTVLKSMLSKWGILSVEMQKAFRDDEQGFTLQDNGEVAGQVIDIEAKDVEETSDENPEDVQEKNEEQTEDIKQTTDGQVEDVTDNETKQEASKTDEVQEEGGQQSLMFD